MSDDEAHHAHVQKEKREKQAEFHRKVVESEAMASPLGSPERAAIVSWGDRRPRMMMGPLCGVHVSGRLRNVRIQCSHFL